MGAWLDRARYLLHITLGAQGCYEWDAMGFVVTKLTTAILSVPHTVGTSIIEVLFESTIYYGIQFPSASSNGHFLFILGYTGLCVHS